MSLQATTLGTKLDQHHAPETNGRMAVCRRCGMRTESPLGLQHIPLEHQLTRSSEWLVAQSRLAEIERVRTLRR